MKRLGATAILALALGTGAQATSAEEITLEHGGLTLNARLERAGESWPRGPVVLMTHGTLAHNRMEIMATLQGLLAEAGLTSLAINLGLGVDDRHGTFSCEKPHAHRDNDAIDEIGLWLDWLEGNGAERVVLLGHSRGGNQTARFAAERDRPEIHAVVLIAPSTWEAGRAARVYEDRFGVPLSLRLEEARDLVAAGKPDAWLEQVGFLYCQGAKVGAATFVDYYAPDERRDTPSVVGKIAKPTIVFAGSEDDVIVGLQESVAPLADGERLKLFVIDGADHFFRDLYADEVVEIIVEEIGDQ